MGLPKKSATCGLAYINVTEPHTAVIISDPPLRRAKTRVVGVSISRWPAGIEPVGGSSIKARFMKRGKYSHVTWLGGNKAKY